MTVGSTKFDKLIETIENQSDEFIKLLDRFQIGRVLIQHGRSKAPTLKVPANCKVSVRDYLKPEEMSRELDEASVIITHGGAGTIFEVLRGKKEKLEALVVVENDGLMDCHQAELIETLIEMECPIQRGDFDNLFGRINRIADIESFKLPDPDYTYLKDLINRYIES